MDRGFYCGRTRAAESKRKRKSNRGIHRNDRIVVEAHAEEDAEEDDGEAGLDPKARDSNKSTGAWRLRSIQSTFHRGDESSRTSVPRGSYSSTLV